MKPINVYKVLQSKIIEDAFIDMAPWYYPRTESYEEYLVILKMIEKL